MGGMKYPPKCAVAVDEAGITVDCVNIDKVDQVGVAIEEGRAVEKVVLIEENDVTIEIDGVTINEEVVTMVDCGVTLRNTFIEAKSAYSESDIREDDAFVNDIIPQWYVFPVGTKSLKVSCTM